VFGTEGLGVLGVQLATYRMLDDWERARLIRDDGVNSYNVAVVTMKYNDLADRFNHLMDAAEHAARLADSLQSRVAARDQEIAELNQQLADAKAETLDVRGKWARTNAYMDRMYKAEDELRALRSQQP
jgi:predicted  nucleic acid-binding Zn-ribbon protein